MNRNFETCKPAINDLTDDLSDFAYLKKNSFQLAANNLLRQNIKSQNQISVGYSTYLNA